ncbi:MAG: bifunctional 5,10-methylene-tetrahydrofolate dehydrogenase/5,10-methylene-tetrahydrofolate cyclohydrolase, partial [Clostridia bacterium]|nr:bifunctional 5,10-methylene-tetrahydrofolate dehydrogenase/5,10-methylene-tetrahydrofolate cyclohydrolase [Clostridia bacterium]
TVTICKRHTQNVENVTNEAEILLVESVNPKFITSKYIKKGAVVIDVGINRTENGICGDVDFENVKEKCEYITPVPGGVGPMTVACLMENTLILHEKYHI